MFFIGIFGIESKQKELQDIRSIICKACGKMSSYKLVKLYTCFHFFFIPLFKWGVHYYVQARCCGAVFEIPGELGSKLEGGADIPVRDEDLIPVNGSYSFNSNICQSCGNQVESKFIYCPYCGTKMK